MQVEETRAVSVAKYAKGSNDDQAATFGFSASGSLIDDESLSGELFCEGDGFDLSAAELGSKVRQRRGWSSISSQSGGD